MLGPQVAHGLSKATTFFKVAKQAGLVYDFYKDILQQLVCHVGVSHLAAQITPQIGRMAYHRASFLPTNLEQPACHGP